MNKTTSNFESIYSSKVDYIKKMYGNNLTGDQKKTLEKLEGICRDISKNLKDLDMSPEEATRTFASVLRQLSLLKRYIENEWKLNKTDYDAVKAKYDKMAKPMLPILQIVKLEKKLETPNLEQLRDINFPILTHDNRTLSRLAVDVFKSLTFVNEEGIAIDKIDLLMLKICKSYNVVTYHNFSHAFSLFLMLYQCYSFSPEFKNFITPFELFCSLLAAISHDLNHKGTNNLYEIKLNTERAKKYNNQSVLENMHISTLFRIFRDNPELDVISIIKDPYMRERAKRILIGCVLATDMSKHFTSIYLFSAKRQAGEVGGKLSYVQAFQKNKPEDRETIMEYIVHSCDIGNPCLEFSNYMNWAVLLSQYFDDQTKKEAAHGVEVTGFLKYVDKPTFYKGQLFFAKNMVKPLWKELSLLWPSLQVFSNQVEANEKKLEQILAEESAS